MLTMLHQQALKHTGRGLLYYLKNNIIIVSNTLTGENSIPYRMKYIVCALALILMAGSSCKSKSEPEIAKEPDIVNESPAPQQPAPENLPPKPSDSHHHTCGKCDDEQKCHHKHKKIPPGHAKKMHGAQSARNYTPGHKKKH
jgi:hypothetical protein